MGQRMGRMGGDDMRGPMMGHKHDHRGMQQGPGRGGPDGQQPQGRCGQQGN